MTNLSLQTREIETRNAERYIIRLTDAIWTTAEQALEQVIDTPRAIVIGIDANGRTVYAPHDA